MNALSYDTSLEYSFFSAAYTHLDVIVKTLESTGDQDHGKTEGFINTAGDEMCRLLLQGYLDKLAHDEQRAVSVTNADGKPRNHVRKGTHRTVTSLFGQVDVSRMGYSQRQTHSLFPLDAKLNLCSDQYTSGVRERIVTDVIDRSYDNAVQRHKKTCAGPVGKRQAMQLAVDTALDFVGFYDGRQVADEQTGDLLVLGFDGKGIVILEEGLREATRRAAAKSTKKLETRLTPGEKKNRKRMAQVAAVYTVHPHIRTAEHVMSSGKKEDKVIPFRPPVRNKRVFASVEREAEQVIEEAFDEALRRDPENKRRWVINIDGHPHQLDLIQRVMKKKNVQATIVMDFIHVLEYLWKAAYCFYSRGSTAAERWVCTQALRVLKGKAFHVAKGIRQSATKRKLKKRKAIDKCADYLQKYHEYLCYEEALSEGLPIASGVIEGACRHLINDRMDITGARWSLQGAEAILKLRSIRSSGDWDAYWQYHRTCSAQRNYGDLDIGAAAS